MEVVDHPLPYTANPRVYTEPYKSLPFSRLCCFDAIDSTQSLSPLCRHLTKNKKATIASGLCKSLILMVPEAGIEPARRERRGILNPLCLPISPLGHRNRYQVRAAGLSIWRHVPESNRTKRICNPLHNRFANAPCKRELALYCLNLERETRLELATPTLARSCSTN